MTRVEKMMLYLALLHQDRRDAYPAFILGMQNKVTDLKTALLVKFQTQDKAVLVDCNLSAGRGAFNGINLPGSRQRLRLSKASDFRHTLKLAFSVAGSHDLIVKSILSGF